MKKMIISNIVFSFLFLFSFSLSHAQCNINTSICNGTNAGPFNFVTPGVHVSTCLDFFGPNVGYIILNISQGGNLNMLIDGNSSGGFIDVAVFNIPQGTPPCTAILSNSNQILCNYASSPSGCNQFGNQFGCPASVGTVNVTAGQQLMIVAENWSGSSSNFTLQLATTPGSAQAGLPDATITPVPSMCLSASPVQMQAVSMGGTWSGDGVSASGLFDPSVAGIGVHKITYNVGISPCTAVDSTFVTVVDNPTISVTSNSPICTGQDLVFSHDTYPGATYTWSGPNGFSTTIDTVLKIHNVTLNNNGTYSVTVNSGGCTNTATTNVTINSTAGIDITPVAPMCFYDTTTMAAVTVTIPGNAPYTGYWSGIGITDSLHGVFDPQIAGPGTHQIYYTVLGACGGIDSTAVVVKPHPDLHLITDLNVGCMPLETNAYVTSSDSLDSLHIDFGNGLFSDTVANPSIVFSQVGCYDVKVWGIHDGCATDSIFPQFYCVNPVPDAIAAVEKNDAMEFHPDFQFINNSKNATSYYWEFGDGTGSADTAPKHSYPLEMPNEYTVVLTATNDQGCKDSSIIYVRVIEEMIFYVPNAFTPDGDEYNNSFQPVFYSGFDDQTYSFRIYNRWGEMLYESHDPKVGWDGTFQGHLVQDGVYTWSISFKSKENSEPYKYTGFVTLIK